MKFINRKASVVVYSLILSMILSASSLAMDNYQGYDPLDFYPEFIAGTWVNEPDNFGFSSELIFTENNKLKIKTYDQQSIIRLYMEADWKLVTTESGSSAVEVTVNHKALNTKGLSDRIKARLEGDYLTSDKITIPIKSMQPHQMEFEIYHMGLRFKFNKFSFVNRSILREGDFLAILGDITVDVNKVQLKDSQHYLNKPLRYTQAKKAIETFVLRAQGYELDEDGQLQLTNQRISGDVTLSIPVNLSDYVNSHWVLLTITLKDAQIDKVEISDSWVETGKKKGSKIEIDKLKRQFRSDPFKGLLNNCHYTFFKQDSTAVITYRNEQRDGYEQIPGFFKRAWKNMDWGFKDSWLYYKLFRIEKNEAGGDDWTSLDHTIIESLRKMNKKIARAYNLKKNAYNNGDKGSNKLRDITESLIKEKFTADGSQQIEIK